MRRFQANECNERETEVSEATLLVTKENAVLFTQPAQNQCGFRLLASALIREISSFSVGSHPQDSYCIIVSLFAICEFFASRLFNFFRSLLTSEIVEKTSKKSRKTDTIF